MKITVALVGNQNSGKTTLFNRLTGSSQHVGNFPGVTVEKKEGTLKKHRNITVVDLPGIYSLSPYTSEEMVTRDFLINEKPDVVINILDATSIERNLYLTLQLLELQIPVVIALNMMDEVAENGTVIDIPVFAGMLGVEAVPISASRNTGIDLLIQKVLSAAKNKPRPEAIKFYSPAVHQALDAVNGLDALKSAGEIPADFAAVKLLEGDEPMENTLFLSENDIKELGLIRECVDGSLDMDREAAFADMRYGYIEKVCRASVFKKHKETAGQRRSVRIDALLTHKIFGIPIFFGVMFSIFWLTFGVFGRFLSNILTNGINAATSVTDNLLTVAGVNETLHSLIIDGVFAGVGSVLSFLPTILILFLFLSLLEDSGYMARVAFVTDTLLRKIGLSGRSIVPMLIGFGCSVPAVMATRTLSADRDKRMTILLIPFMSCSAKLPIYSVFTMAFFPKYQAVVMIFLYIFGILTSLIYALLLKKFYYKGESTPFIMELPAYRLPSTGNILLHIWDKARDFITRAFTVIFLTTIIIWLMQRFDFQFHLVSDGSDSILATLGRTLAPVFAPLGFGDWRAATALLTGLSAKETVIATLAVLTGASDSASLIPTLSSMFSPLSAISFLIFTLLYMPCVAAMAAIRREFGSTSGALYAMLYQTLIAWLAAFTVFRLGIMLGF